MIDHNKLNPLLWGRDRDKGATRVSEPEICGCYGCTWPAGHNRGRANIPANHEPVAELLRTAADGVLRVLPGALGAHVRAGLRSVAELTEYSPHGYDPAEWLQGARTVLVLAEQVGATLAMHTAVGTGVCAHCHTDTGEPVEWPCATVSVLSGGVS